MRSTRRVGPKRAAWRDPRRYHRRRNRNVGEVTDAPDNRAEPEQAYCNRIVAGARKQRSGRCNGQDLGETKQRADAWVCDEPRQVKRDDPQTVKERQDKSGPPRTAE